MYKKTTFKHNFVEAKGLSLTYEVGTDHGQGWQGIRYFDIPHHISSQIMEIIPFEFRHLFFARLMIINRPEIPPHIDNGILSTINFYINTSNATTYFYKAKSKFSIEYFQLENQHDGKIIHSDSIHKVGEFKAEAGEVWILDVKQPHSVICDSNENRTAYCLQSMVLDFQSLLSMNLDG